MKFAIFVFTLALATFSAAAQDQQSSITQSPTSVLINGQPIKGKVFETEGKHYLAVEDVAQSLRGTIGYGDGQITLMLPLRLPVVTAQPPLPQVPSDQPTSEGTSRPSAPVLPKLSPPPLPAAAQPPASSLPPAPANTSESGRIQGTVTYLLNVQTGNKPDAGTKLWLVQGHVEIPVNQDLVATSTALGTSGNPEHYSAIKYSTADENGKFELLDIPPGQYTLVLQSAHTKGTLNEKRSFFGRGNGRNPRDSGGRVEFLVVVIKAGETVDASKDFGPNIDM